MRQSVMLALQKVMQRQCLRVPSGCSFIGGEPARDRISATGDLFQLGLERGCFLAIGMSQSRVARRELKDAPSRCTVLRPGLPDDVAQDFAVALRCDRQAMIEIPGREGAFAGIIA